MKILFLQLSDIHIAKRADGYAINIEKIVQAINFFGDIDECIIIVSGDITQHGYSNEFKVAGDMLGNLVNQLKNKNFNGKWLNIVVVPGNHDLDFTNNDRTFGNIVEALKHKKEEILIENDLASLKSFYEFAGRNKCFTDDKIVSHKQIRLNNIYINFTLINTAIFSLCGSSNEDMGIHYLNTKDIGNLIPKARGDLNIVVMHHSYEWFTNGVKEDLRYVLRNNFSIVFGGHEHDGLGQQTKINNENTILYIQGNSLSGDKNHQKGFTATVYNSDNKSVKGYSFLWEKDFYKPKKILDELLPDKSTQKFKNCQEFIEQLEYDDNHKLISQYFVFPSLSYNIIDESDELVTKIIDDAETFLEFILINDRTIISGESKAGKSTLAKVLYQNIINGDTDIVPLLLVSEDLRNKKIHKIPEYAFKEQYEAGNNSYDKFLQLEKANRLLIIDDANKITKTTLEKVFEVFYDLFDKIVLFSDERVNLNIKKQVVDALTEEKVGHLSIRPFLYDKRKLLISKVYGICCLPGEDDNPEQTIDSLNRIISSQIRYFRLDPDFIINFVTQYFDKYKFDFTTGSNVFSIVYETSIRNKIINNVDPGDVSSFLRIMCDIAYYMHFNKLAWLSVADISKIIEVYNKEFRQDIKISVFLEAGQKSKLIIEKESKIKFKDNNLLSYFVAQSLNIRYSYEDVTEKIEYLLNNLCFGINSDIVLFLALITNNPKIINVVLGCASKHFDQKEELNFDLKNISFLCQSDFTVKDAIPDHKEKQEKEVQLIKYEEQLKADELIELVGEYEYDENDLATFENQVIKSVKYLEVLSKILPSFSYNMKAEQQDMLVHALYSFPNRFIFQFLNEISDNYQEIVEETYEEIAEIRKEKNIAALHIDRVKKMLEQMSIYIVVTLYQLVAGTATTNKTIKALNAFNYSGNSNYAIMNLMMVEKTSNIKEFCEKAIKLYDKSEMNLMKSLVKFTVRNFYLNHDVSFVRETQSLLDKFFNEKLSKVEKDKIKIEMAMRKAKRI